LSTEEGDYHYLVKPEMFLKLSAAFQRYVSDTEQKQ
jgi:hypothetical protein